MDLTAKENPVHIWFALFILAIIFLPRKTAPQRILRSVAALSMFLCALGLPFAILLSLFEKSPVVAAIFTAPALFLLFDFLKFWLKEEREAIKNLTALNRLS
jgi:hypothetical protein